MKHTHSRTCPGLVLILSCLIAFIAASATAAPPLTKSFEGLRDSGAQEGVYYPDASLAVGPNHLFISQGTAVAVQDKESGQILYSDLINEFLMPYLGDNTGTFFSYPQCAYDTHSDRFLYAVSMDVGTSDAAYALGISKTSDPTGDWDFWYFKADPSNILGLKNLAIGFNKHWIVLAGDYYAKTTDVFVSKQIMAFSRADIVSGATSPSVTVFNRTGQGTHAVPCQIYDTDEEEMFLLSLRDANQGILRLDRLQLAGDGNTYYVQYPVSPEGPAWIGLPDVPQFNTDQKVRPGDANFRRAVLRDGIIYATHTIGVQEDGGGSHAAVQWWQIDAHKGQTLQTGRIDTTDTEDKYSYFTPSIDANERHQVFIGFSGSSSSTYISSYYATRTPLTPEGETTTPSRSREGLAEHYKSPLDPYARWGRYSGAGIDPVDGGLWGLTPYAGGFEDSKFRWRLRVTKIASNRTTDAEPLYFPRVRTDGSWATELGFLNLTETDIAVTLTGFSAAGVEIATAAISIPAGAKTTVDVASALDSSESIAYCTASGPYSQSLRGYARLSQEGEVRVAIPAANVAEHDEIYVPHIASDGAWSTEIVLVNTSSSTQTATVTFNTDETREVTVAPFAQAVVNVDTLFGQPRPDIRSAKISGFFHMVGLELFRDGNQLTGMQLNSKTASTLYYPHVDSGLEWRTGIVAYNPAASETTLTITCYDAAGLGLGSFQQTVAAESQFVGFVDTLPFPETTAWFKIDATSPVAGFELFGTRNENQLAGYSVHELNGQSGFLPILESAPDWTGISLVNLDAQFNNITLTAHAADGSVIASKVHLVPGHGKVVNFAEQLFDQEINGAAYLTWSSTRQAVLFELNSDGERMELDALPSFDLP